MKTHMLLGAVVVLSACTHATSVMPSSMTTSAWGVGEPASPLGDGTSRATEQTTSVASSPRTTTTTNTTLTSSGAGAKAAEVDGDATRTGSVERDALPRSINFTPRPINTGDPCGDCARAR